MLEAYTSIYEYLTMKGFKPKLNVTDNKCSKLLKRYIQSQDVDILLVEPDNYRLNAAKRAIQTFKNHFVAGLASINPAFPMQLGCYLLCQAELTLHLLQTS